MAGRAEAKLTECSTTICGMKEMHNKSFKADALKGTRNGITLHLRHSVSFNASAPACAA